ncbi:MAG: hypothetical protein CL916_07595 [Deltaproteobacteria bacterium]|nr:hypothetical protein [Deltaproteobacteria bacterium]
MTKPQFIYGTKTKYLVSILQSHVVHPNILSPDALPENFSGIHTHHDNEIRSIIDNSGIFRFILYEKEQTIIRTIRYLTTPDGWSSNDTQRSILE